jgi:hypothetical protein
MFGSLIQDEASSSRRASNNSRLGIEITAVGVPEACRERRAAR